MDCEICRMIKDGRFTIYEDDLVVAMLDPQPAAIGHVIIVSKGHHTIMEQVPDYVMEAAGKLTQQASMALFDSVAAQGTNILIRNGDAAGQDRAHFIIDVLARHKDDGISFEWTPKQPSPDELRSTYTSLAQYTRPIGNFEQKKPEPVKMVTKLETLDDADENYLIEQLRRIP